MRKNVVFFGGAMFFACCFSLYLLLQSSSNNTKQSLYADEEVNELESKINNMENELKENHKTIMFIKDLLKDLSKNDTQNIDKIKNILKLLNNWSTLPGKEFMKIDQRVHVSNSSKRFEVAIPQETCRLSSLTIEKPTLEMLEAYSTIPFDNIDGGSWKQGWNIQYNKQLTAGRPLKIFVVPHSHNDPGWIKTFDRYYDDQTANILNNMVRKLEEHPRMTFIYAEISFFSKWWQFQTDDVRNRVKKLIEQGRLEIPTAGWVMTDEANSHYFAMLDQMIEGNNWLLENVGIKPSSGWSIDPFGQSPTMAYLLKKMQFKNMLIQRIHYSVKKYLASKQNLEFMWRQNWDSKGTTDIFCHMMPFYSYDVPHTCGPDPKICCQFDFKRLPGGRIGCPWSIPPVAINSQNVAEKAKTLLDQYRKKSSLYRSDIVLIPLGDDFRYDTADEWDKQYSNYQTLFDYINSQTDWHAEAKFGTLNDYFEALSKRENVPRGDKPKDYPILGGDFFTYADRDDHYWSGYFTSRPFYKRMDRFVESSLRSAEIIYSIAKINGINNFDSDKQLEEKLTFSRQSLGLFQHHDAITGTAKDFVMVDYAMKLLRSIENSKIIMNTAIQFLLSSNNLDTLFDFDEVRNNYDSLPTKHLLSITTKLRYVVFYNSLANNRTNLVSILVDYPYVTVRDNDNQIIKSQVNPVWDKENIYLENKFQLLFSVSLSGFGIVRYSIEKSDRNGNFLHSLGVISFYKDIDNQQTIFVNKIVKEGTIEIQNNEISIKINRETGTISEMKNKKDNIESKCKVEFLSYGTRGSKERSGAYLFLPNGEAKIIESPSIFTRSVKGPLLSEVTTIMKHVIHNIRIENTDGLKNFAVDIENIVDIQSESNFELVMRIVTDLESKDEFFTDLNGFQIQKRRYFSKIPLQGNFYPIPSMIFIEDKTRRFSILTSQSLGGGSLNTGWLEIIQDRRLNQDDNRGLGQGVLDNKITSNRFQFLLEKRLTTSSNKWSSSGFASLQALKISHEVLHEINILPILSDKLKPYEYASKIDNLKTSLSCDLHVVNLRSNLKDASQFSLILHRFAPDCSIPYYGSNCKVGSGKIKLDNLFSSKKELKKVRTTSLNLITDGSDINFKELPVEIESMEIEAFKLIF